jgi:hypothetical protein
VPLRDPDIIGMTDPRDLTNPPNQRRRASSSSKRAVDKPDENAPRDVRDPPEPPISAPTSPSAERPTAELGAGDRPPAIPAGPPTPQDIGALSSSSPAISTVDDVERAFVQILVPPELAVRISRASHYLKLNAYKARFQQTIIGALIEQQIPDPDDPLVVSAMASLIARWRQDPLSERRAARRLGWHLPLAVSTRLDQLLLNLKEQYYRLRPSATALLAALIWLELDPESAAGQAALRDLVVSYHHRWEEPAYEVLTAA